MLLPCGGDILRFHFGDGRFDETELSLIKLRVNVQCILQNANTNSPHNLHWLKLRHNTHQYHCQSHQHCPFEHFRWLRCGKCVQGAVDMWECLGVFVLRVLCPGGEFQVSLLSFYSRR